MYFSKRLVPATLEQKHADPKTKPSELCWKVLVAYYTNVEGFVSIALPRRAYTICCPKAYLWLVGNGRMVVIVVIIVPHSSIPY